MAATQRSSLLDAWILANQHDSSWQHFLSDHSLEFAQAQGITADVLKERRRKLRNQGLMTVKGRPVAGTPPPELPAEVAAFTSDKKMGSFDWREWSAKFQELQALKDKASYSQDFSTIDFSHITEPICVICVSDTHWGSWSTDYEQLERVTDEILSTPNLYLALLGDLEQASIKLRSVLEVGDNIIPMELQHRFTEAWLEEMQGRILFSCWDNHSVMREENQAGYSRLSDLLKRRVIYHNHIGHTDLLVGKQTYRLAISHRFRGNSYMNPLHAQMRYGRMEGLDREIIMQGDTHVPGITMYTDGEKHRIAINSGTIQTNSGYGKRFFSLYTHSVYPCLELWPNEHLVVPYWSLRAWKAARAER